jgi:hypothetical protein
MQRYFQIILGILTSFVALTAIGGGIAILTEIDKFPIEWLDETPFKSYTIPAFLVIILVGGGALLAAINILFKRKNASRYSFISGIILICYIIVEILLLKQIPPGPTPIEIFYLMLGTIISAIALFFQHKKT